MVSLGMESDEPNHKEEKDVHEPELHHGKHGPSVQLPLDLGNSGVGVNLLSAAKAREKRESS